MNFCVFIYLFVYPYLLIKSYNVWIKETFKLCLEPNKTHLREFIYMWDDKPLFYVTELHKDDGLNGWLKWVIRYSWSQHSVGYVHKITNKRQEDQGLQVLLA